MAAVAVSLCYSGFDAFPPTNTRRGLGVQDDTKMPPHLYMPRQLLARRTLTVITGGLLPLSMYAAGMSAVTLVARWKWNRG